MSTFVNVLVALCVVWMAACMCAALLIGWGWKGRHSREMAVLARTSGWTYRQTAALTFAGQPPFKLGPPKNVLDGTVGTHPFVAFEAEVGSIMYAFVMMGLPTWLSKLEVNPRHTPEAVGGGLKLESEAFNRRYTVRASDPRMATDVLTPRVMSAVLAGAPFAFRLDGREFLSWCAGEIKAAMLHEQLTTMSAVLDGVPAFVWNDHRAVDRTPGPEVK